MKLDPNVAFKLAGDVMRDVSALEDSEVPCEVTIAKHPYPRLWARMLGVNREETPCPNPADWLIVFDHHCPGYSQHGYLCETHCEQFLTDGASCTECGREMVATLTERLR